MIVLAVVSIASTADWVSSVIPLAKPSVKNPPILANTLEGDDTFVVFSAVDMASSQTLITAPLSEDVASSSSTPFAKPSVMFVPI